MNAVAFSKVNPFGARINAIFSSDIGHFDVPDMVLLVPEAYELVEDGLISDEISATSPLPTRCKLWGTQNPHFFEGTRGRQGSRSGARRTALAIEGRRRITCAVILRRQP